MSVFLSLIDKRGQKIEANLFRGIIGYSDNTGLTANEYWLKENVGIYQYKELSYSSIHKDQNIFLYSEHSIIICLDSRIDYREELVKKMNLNWHSNECKSDAQLLYNAYLNWGKECVNHLFGDFSFCIWDSSKGELICARDHFGCRPFYWFENENYLCVSNDISPFFRIPNHGITVNQYSVVEFLISKLPNSKETFYNNISRLEPASILEYSKKDGLSIEKYWKLVIPEEKVEISFADAVDELKTKLNNSIFERIKNSQYIGAELSGGLDSSSIVAIASQICKNTGKGIKTYSHTLDVDLDSKRYPFIDESKYSNALISYSKIENHEQITSRDKGILKTIIYALEKLIIPQNHSYVYLSDSLLEKANIDQVSVLLSGFGGDEGITSNHKAMIEELAKQKKWHIVREILRYKYNWCKYGYYKVYFSVKFLALFPKLGGNLFNLMPKKTRIENRYKTFPISNQIKEIYELKRHQLVNSESDTKMEPDIKYASRLFEGHITYRLENACNYARTFNIEYAYPLLDVKLLEFFYSIPIEYHFDKGQGRSLIRHAMKDMLPDEIRLRDNKTQATLPSVQSRFYKDYNNFRALIEDSKQNNQFHYINYDKAISMLEDLKLRDDGRALRYGPKHFFNIIQILILQKWQREGKIDIGIKC